MLISLAPNFPDADGANPRFRQGRVDQYAAGGGFQRQASRYVALAGAGHEARRAALDVEAILPEVERMDYNDLRRTRAGRARAVSSPVGLVESVRRISGRIVEIANVRSGFWAKTIYRPTRAPELLPIIGAMTEFGLILMVGHMILSSGSYEPELSAAERAAEFKRVEADFVDQARGKTIEDVDVTYREMDSRVRRNVSLYNQANQAEVEQLPEFIDARSLVDEVLALE